MNNITLECIQQLHRDGYLQADFKLFGVPQNEEELQDFLRNYQRIRNQAAGA
jgi:hypothetical protein